MGQSLRVHRDMTRFPTPSCLLIALVPSGVRVLQLWESTIQKLVCSFRPLLPGRANPCSKWNPDWARPRSIAGNTCNKCANGEVPGSIRHGTRFSGGSPENVVQTVRGLVRRYGPIPTSANPGELLPADVAGIGMRHDYPSPDNSLSLTYFRDRRQVLSFCRFKWTCGYPPWFAKRPLRNSNLSAHRTNHFKGVGYMKAPNHSCVNWSVVKRRDISPRKSGGHSD